MASRFNQVLPVNITASQISPAAGILGPQLASGDVVDHLQVSALNFGEPGVTGYDTSHNMGAVNGDVFLRTIGNVHIVPALQAIIEGNARINGALTEVGIADTSATGSHVLNSFNPLVVQSGTAGYIGLVVNVTEAATGTGTKLLFQLDKNSVPMLSVTDVGAQTIAAGLGVWGHASPGAQPTISGSRGSATAAVLAALLTALANTGLIVDSTTA